MKEITIFYKDLDHVTSRGNDLIFNTLDRAIANFHDIDIVAIIDDNNQVRYFKPVTYSPRVCPIHAPSTSHPRDV